jgi:hypothetical protein
VPRKPRANKSESGKPRAKKPVEESILPEPEPETALAPTEADEPIDADVKLFDEALPVPAEYPDIPDVDSDLDEEQRKEFVAILNREFSLAERAQMLIKLARSTDTKRAPVALRAIQEINRVTRITPKDDQDGDGSSMFVLPLQANISTVVKVPEK